MRYYNLTLKTNTAAIEKNTKVRLRDLYYDNAIGAVNAYMYKSLKNGVNFFCYREEENNVDACFCYNDKLISYQEAYDMITTLLRETFEIKKIVSEPVEITMYQMIENFSECKRRDYYTGGTRLVDAANLWLYHVDARDEIRNLRYTLDEDIISEKTDRKSAIYDKTLINEIANIEAHDTPSEFSGNMVHYFISSHSLTAARDIAGTLMESLYKAKRVSSRRVEVVSEIYPDVYKGNNHIEELIENNFGGCVIFDLSEKFACDPVDYVNASKYIENLFRKYRNKVLFIFTYNMDRPGFSYQLLPHIKNYAIPVSIREGKGDKKTAVKYMESLIKKTPLAKYADQAADFMKLFPGTEFTQTEVLEAYEKFDSWCINRNVLKAYNFNPNGDFMLERDEDTESSYDRLNSMIGLNSVKKQMDDIISANIIEKERKNRKGSSYSSGSMHMCFMGNPGAGKTEVAKLFAGICKEKGILKSGAFVMRGGMDLDGLGCVEAIREAFTAAKDGCLFIDECYSMTSSTAVTALVQALEENRNEVICILAGYADSMKEWLERNEGLKSRIPYFVDFPDYSTEELTEIFRLMVRQQGYNATDEAVNKAQYILNKARYMDGFGNGRYVRSLLQNAIKNQSVRLRSENEDVTKIDDEKMYLITEADITGLDDGLREERPAGTAQKELDDMIGLKNVKKVLRKAISNFKMTRKCIARGIEKDTNALHMVFTGAPGTAKTTCARLLAEILKDEKVLPSGNYVEVSRADLVGAIVGSTAKIVKKKFKDARGGVLFIDEAYALVDSHENSFGDEAIAQIVAEMENNRDNTIVIFGGYPDKMKDFLDRNPGMRSRIAFHVSFDDYTVDELIDIAKLMVSKKHMTITDVALAKLRAVFEAKHTDPNFGNGRGARKLIEEAEMNLAERISNLNDDELSNEFMTTIEECDIPDDLKGSASASQKIGFVC